MSSQILLYSGIGASPTSVDAFERRFRELVDDRTHMLRTVTCLSSSCWTDPKSVKALIIPSGNAPLMWTQHIGTVASLVRDTINKYQIGYFGACAGGILATSSFHDRLPEHLQPHTFYAQGSEFLKLFPGKAIGPLNPKKHSELSFEDIQLITLPLCKTAAVCSINLFASAFLDVDQIKGAKVGAAYDGLPPFSFKDAAPISPQKLSDIVFYQQNETSPPLLLTGSSHEISGVDVAFSSEFESVLKMPKKEQKELSQGLVVYDLARAVLLESCFKKIGITCKQIKGV